MAGYLNCMLNKEKTFTVYIKNELKNKPDHLFQEDSADLRVFKLAELDGLSVISTSQSSVTVCI
jgi:hypothetical protein